MILTHYRGIPWLNRTLLQNMPEDAAVPAANRPGMAFVLTCHIFAGIALGIAAQAGILIGLIGYILPALGGGLWDQARALVDADYGGALVRLLLGPGG